MYQRNRVQLFRRGVWAGFILQVIGRFFGIIRRKSLQSMMDWAIPVPFMPRMIRLWLLRRIGCHVGKNVF